MTEGWNSYKGFMWQLFGDMLQVRETKRLRHDGLSIDNSIIRAMTGLDAEFALMRVNQVIGVDFYIHTHCFFRIMKHDGTTRG